MIIILSSFLLIFLTLSSCEEDRVCPDSWHCDEFNNPYIGEIYIEALIEEDKFKPTNVRYCSTHRSEIEKRSKSKGIDNLKLRMYNSRNNIAYEKDIYLVKNELGKRHVIIYLDDGLSTQHTIKIVELNEKNEEIKILAEIKTTEIPLVPLARQYKCEKYPFILNSESKDEVS